MKKATYLVVLALCFIMAACGDKKVNEEVDLVEKNKKLVLDYYDKVVFGGRVDLIGNYVASGYIQHSPFVESGREALVSLIRDVIHGPDVEKPFGEIVRVIAEDDLVLLHIRAFSWPNKNGTVVVDMFRIDDGLIVEHWDVVQAIPAEKSVNGNTMF